MDVLYLFLWFCSPTLSVISQPRTLLLDALMFLTRHSLMCRIRPSPIMVQWERTPKKCQVSNRSEKNKTLVWLIILYFFKKYLLLYWLYWVISRLLSIWWLPNVKPSWFAKSCSRRLCVKTLAGSTHTKSRSWQVVWQMMSTK